MRGYNCSILWNAFRDAQRKAKIETDFGKSWLGHLLSYLGEKDKDVIYNIPCRGNITFMEIDSSNSSISIDTETAWRPMPLPIVKMIEKYAPDAKICYTAIEAGCGLYVSDNPSDANKYLIDVMGDVPETINCDYDFLSENELCDMLQKSLNIKAELPSLIKTAEDKWDISINKIEKCDLKEWM